MMCESIVPQFVNKDYELERPTHFLEFYENSFLASETLPSKWVLRQKILVFDE